jgi:putative membrane protein
MDAIQLLINTGWNLLWLPIIWSPALIPATQSWRLLFGEHPPPGFLAALVATWIGRAVNNLLPVASIGGEIVKARLVHIWGTEGISAAASVMIDKASQALALALWGMTGVICLTYLSTESDLALYASAGFFILIVCTVIFVVLQKMGMLGFLAGMGGKLIKSEGWKEITFNAREIDIRINDVYRHKIRLAMALFLRTLGLVLQTGEVWLACMLLNHPIGIIEAIMLKSLTSTVSDIAFVIPNAYGIQEGAFIVIGAIIGIPPDVALVLSLAIRIRDFILDPAGLLVLHQIEHRQFNKKYKNASPE